MMRSEILCIFLLLALFGASTTAYSDEISCPPTISGVSVKENVIVVDSCVIEGSEVQGNVEIRSNGELEITGSEIRGNIKMLSYGTVFLFDSTVSGNIECAENGGEVLVGCLARIEGSIQEKCASVNVCH